MDIAYKFCSYKDSFLGQKNACRARDEEIVYIKRL